MMTIADVFETSRHRENIAHFTAIVNIAAIDGAINTDELTILQNFAKKLDISKEEYQSIIKNPDTQPFIAIASSEERLSHIYDLFRMIYADHAIDSLEKNLIVKYAIGLGVPIKEAQGIIDRSIDIFDGRLDFDEYLHLLKK